MDELGTIRTFLAVARNRSFADAARQLRAPPATVTRAVSSLERSLGTQLLVRTTRQVSLTSAGAAYAARVEPLVRDIDSLADDFRSGAEADSGLLRINAPMSLGLKLLPPILSGFRTQYPRIELSVSLSDEFVDIVGADFDLAIRISEPPTDKSTIWRKICPVERILVTATGSTTANVETPEDLDPSQCFAFSAAGREETWMLGRNGQTRSVRAGGRFSANSGDLLAQLVESDGGAALLPRFIVEDAIANGRLVQILRGWTPPLLWLSLYYPPYEKLPPRVAGFSDYFEEYVTVTSPVSPAEKVPEFP
ncbi:LysR substrate-binding domain-containing protein [Hoeflea sp. CAU 1731]